MMDMVLRCPGGGALVAEMFSRVYFRFLPSEV